MANHSLVVHAVYYTAPDGSCVGIMDWREVRLDVRRAIVIYDSLVGAKMPLVVRCENHRPAESWSRDTDTDAGVTVCPQAFRYEDGSVWSKEWRV